MQHNIEFGHECLHALFDVNRTKTLVNCNKFCWIVSIMRNTQHNIGFDHKDLHAMTGLKLLLITLNL